MKKTASQITSFLSQHSFKSDLEWKRIMTICLEDVNIDKTLCYEISPENGITLSDFLYWYDNLFGAGDICFLDGQLVICGKCDLRHATVIAKLSDGKLSTCDLEVPQSALKMASGGDCDMFMLVMMKQNLQFSQKEHALVERYTPKPGDRVVFIGPDFWGLGVVKGIDQQADSVDFFCYHVDGTGETGFSMHEDSVFRLSEVIFEPISGNKTKTSQGNGQYLQRKLNQELAVYGKVWRDKLHRIEPVSLISVGSPYWYINEKMELIGAVETGGQVSRRRYCAGNYFTSYEEGLEYLGKFTSMLRDRLAFPDPEYPSPKAWNDCKES